MSNKPLPYINSTYYPAVGLTRFSGTADYHGGYAFEHRSEMKAISEKVANEIFDRKFEIVLHDLYEVAKAEAYIDLVKDLTFDVSTCVRVAFENAGTILNDKATQKVVADNLMREITKQLNRLKL